jgi:predicted nucleic acid-binding protein
LNFLVDTNVLSEATKARPDARAARWLEASPAHALFVSVISIAEIRRGVLLLPSGKRREKLERWLDSALRPAFAGRLLTLGEQEMNAWAELQASAEKTGRRIPVIDSLLAATARCHGLTIATRNVDDFRHCGVPVINPWAANA